MSRATRALRADVCIVFRGVKPGGVVSRGRVLAELPCPGASPRDGTTPGLRCDRHGRGQCSDPLGVFSAPSQECRALLPSAAKSWWRVSGSPVRVGRGGGAAHVTVDDPSPSLPEPARVSHPSVRLRETGPRRPVAFPDAVPEALGTLTAGASLWVSRAASGSPAPRPSGRRHRSLATAGFRLSLEETARASF